MNQFTAHEHAAACQLQAKAATIVCTYAAPQDAAAARLAVLMLAAEKENLSQGDKRHVILISQELLKVAARFTKGDETPETMSMLEKQLFGMLESISFLHQEIQDENQ